MQLFYLSLFFSLLTPLSLFYYLSLNNLVLPDGKRAELIDGTLYDMAPPTRIHQRIVTELGTAINNHIKKNNGSCEVNVSPFDVYLEGNDTNYVEPDISVICDKNKLDESGCHGAPDWIIEVVSPSSTRMDYFIKLFKYRTAGVREYWIVNPTTKTVQTYIFSDVEDSNQYSFENEIPVYIFQGFAIRVRDWLE